jgi:hypothetical protein
MLFLGLYLQAKEEFLEIRMYFYSFVVCLSHVASFPYWRLRLVSCGFNPGFTTPQNQSRAYQDEPGRTNTKEVSEGAEEV